MGEIVEMILDGTLCEHCGGLVEAVIYEDEPVGYPRLCDSCKEEQKRGEI